MGDLGRRFIEHRQPSLEAQLANIADEIAYNNHDVDDGLRAGLISVEQLMEIELFREPYTQVTQRYPGLPTRRLIHETVRRMIDGLITDLIESSRANIAAAAPDSIEAVRALPRPLINFSHGIGPKNQALARFLRAQLYHHPQVRRAADKAMHIVRELFSVYFNNPEQIPDSLSVTMRANQIHENAIERARKVADYIAGMTDRYALRAYRRATDQTDTLSGHVDSA